MSDPGDGILAGERTGDIAGSEICNKSKQIMTIITCPKMMTFRPKVDSPDSSSSRLSRFARCVFVVL